MDGPWLSSHCFEWDQIAKLGRPLGFVIDGSADYGAVRTQAQHTSECLVSTCLQVLPLGTLVAN